MPDELCLLAVHAHPDDESSKGAGTVARYRAEGVRTVLVCCTGGEEGDILNPAMDLPEIRENLPAVRMRELSTAASIIGYDETVMLGYRDSGMPDSPANANPASFASAPLEEATGRLVEVIRRTRPQVILAYHEDQRRYPHPDHLRAHDIATAAFVASGDPSAFPRAGASWQPSKLYYSVWSSGRAIALHEKFLELGIESPFDQSRLSAPEEDPEKESQERPVTRIDVSAYENVRRSALAAHATQIDPTSKWWFGLPAEVSAQAWPWEEWELARNLVGPIGAEEDLFAGLRHPEGSSLVGGSLRARG